MDAKLQTKLEAAVLDFVKVWTAHESKIDDDVEYINLIAAVFTFKTLIEVIAKQNVEENSTILKEIEAKSIEIAQSILDRQKTVLN